MILKGIEFVLSIYIGVYLIIGMTELVKKITKED